MVLSVLDTLEICFSANLSGVDAQLEGLSGQLRGLSGAALETAGAMRPVGDRMVSALRSALTAGLPGVRQDGDRLIASLRSALTAGLPAIRREGGSAAAQFASGARGGVAGASSAGLALSKGLAAGIRSGKGAVGSAVASVVNAALSRMRSLLAIHSPSKVTRGFGEHFGEGFALGIDATAQRVYSAAENLGGGAVAGLDAPALPRIQPGGDMGRIVESAVARALGDMNVVIPLNVDGMKLGEASIRGINAVTKSAGRVLLNI